MARDYKSAMVFILQNCVMQSKRRWADDRKNEGIDILKIGLSGIAKRYGYQNVQEFYRIYYQSHSAYAAYREQEVE